MVENHGNHRMTHSQGNALNRRHVTELRGHSALQRLSRSTKTWRIQAYWVIQWHGPEEGEYKQVTSVIHPNGRGLYKLNEKKRFSVCTGLYKRLPNLRPSPTTKSHWRVRLRLQRKSPLRVRPQITVYVGGITPTTTHEPRSGPVTV